MPALHRGCETGRYRQLTQKPNGVEASLVSLCRLLCNLLKQEILVNRRTATSEATQPIHYSTLEAPFCKQGLKGYKHNHPGPLILFDARNDAPVCPFH
jgi:hypothetical protein